MQPPRLAQADGRETMVYVLDVTIDWCRFRHQSIVKPMSARMRVGIGQHRAEGRLYAGYLRLSWEGRPQLAEPDGGLEKCLL